jgi:hypothetical protein
MPTSPPRGALAVTFAKLCAADIWIILDDVQFTRRDYQHRCYLARLANARLPGRWLTIPVRRGLVPRRASA